MVITQGSPSSTGSSPNVEADAADFAALAEADALIAAAPGVAAAHNLRGEALARLFRWDEAISAFSHAIGLDAGTRQYRLNLANTHAACGNLKEAAALFAAALREDRRDLATFNALAAVLQGLDRHAEAIRACELALQVDPDFADVRNRIAQSHLALENYPQAIAAAKALLDRHPGHRDGLYNLALAYMRSYRHEEAVSCLEELIIRSNGADDELYLQLGNALSPLGRYEEAAAAYLEMIARHPDWGGGYFNLGHVRVRQRRWDEAMECYRRAMAIEPANPDHYYAIACCRLQQGRLAEGFAAYEFRNHVKDGLPRLAAPIPVWQGEPLAGKRLLLVAEQGLGDVAMMARYIPLLMASGASVTFHGAQRMRPLLSRTAPGLAFADGPVDPADHDFQLLAMSLPQRLKTRLDTIPASVPWFFAEPERVAKWKARLGTTGFRIGINWQGNPRGVQADWRAVPLEHFAPIAALPGVRLISLQHGQGREDLARMPSGVVVEDMGPGIDADGAFLDTLAIVANLDLVITSDTSLVHIAGGSGAPVYLALTHSAEWRWLDGRSDTPWYPSVTLFRQPGFGDWAGAFAAMAAALRARLSPSAA